MRVFIIFGFLLNGRSAMMYVNTLILRFFSLYVTPNIYEANRFIFFKLCFFIYSVIRPKANVLTQDP